MQEKNLVELSFAPIHAEPVFAFARIQENIVEEQFSSCFPYLGGELMSVQIHAAPVSAPARIQENVPGNYYALVSCQGVVFSADSLATKRSEGLQPCNSKHVVTLEDLPATFRP